MMKLRLASQVILIPVLVLVGCAPAEVISTEPASLPAEEAPPASETGEPAGEPEPAPADQVAGLEEMTIDEFFEASFDLILLRYPEWITELGIADRYGLRNDRLDDMSDEYVLATYDLEQAVLDALHTYDYAALSADQQVSYDVYEWWLESELAGREFMYHDYPVHHFVNGYPDELMRLFTEVHPMETREDAEDYLARLAAVDTQLQQVTEGVSARAGMGIMIPDFIIDMTVSRMRNDLAMRSSSTSSINPASIELYIVFRDKLAEIEGLSEDEKQAMLATALQEVEQSFVPAYVALMEAVQALEPLATDDAGLWRLPEGDAYYQYLLHEQNSTGMTPQEIHDLGLAEVERLQAELRTLFAGLGYPEDEPLQTSLNRAIQEGGFVSGETATLDAYYALIDDIEVRLPEVFDVSPAADLVIVAEPAGGGGFYSPGTIDGSRPGAFHAGIGSMSALYHMPTLTYHETVPGHHFQIALAQEMDLPLFRNAIQYNGYAEGWALYAERLAWELGVYEDNPYGDIGRLELELLRAARLVTDTGIHALGWSREEARDYLREAMGGDNWVHEVERYIVLPAQATSYKVGMIAILTLRDRAEEALGDQFDIVEFHHVVLSNGSMPLEVLERVVEGWVASKLAE